VTFPGEIVVSGDPNDKLGAKGFGAAHHISGRDRLRYSVLFENVPTASAPAATVAIRDTLDVGTLDLSTVELGPITFSGQTVMPTPGPLAAQGSYMTTADLRPARNLAVRISAALNTTSGLLTWAFTTLDPSTGAPPADPLAGFLAPGAEGSVSFSVAPKASTATGTQLTNKATIVFDANAPMNTPVWLNTLDATGPVSRVATMASAQSTTCFKPQWTGSDVGAGLKGITVFVSDNGGPYTPWLTNTTSTTAVFNGLAGHSYGFYSQATDAVGNVEAAKTAAEATTSVGAAATCNGRPAISGAIIGKSTTGATMTLTLQLTNSGLGAAQNAVVNQITFRTLTGTGTVSLAGPVLPVSVGGMAAGGSIVVTLTLNVPATVKQFSLTESGTLQDLAGGTFSFAVGQNVIP
jgi:hypothetical protein